MRLPADEVIVRHLAGRDARFRYRQPRYQLQMLKDLGALIPEGPCRVLDIGAGSGLIGEAISTLFPGKSVVGVDVAPNAASNLRIAFARFDGRRLPFADRAFDCALFCNVLHHVKPDSRPELLREALRVTGGGPVIIKDHLAASAADRIRLWLLDVAGNLTLGFMISADYLDGLQWDRLLQQAGCMRDAAPVSSAYRSGWSGRWFPNRLEIAFSVRRPARSI